MVKKTDKKIHKDNKIIKSSSINHLTIHSLKILDNLYYHTQKHLNKTLGVGESRKLTLDRDFTLPVRQTTLREWLGLEEENNYQKKIRESLKQLETSIEVFNFIENGEAYTWGLKSFIKNITESKSKEDNKSKLYSITIDKFLYNTILTLKGNFTEINLNYQKSWKSSNTLRLYQYLKSIQNITDNKVHNLEWFNDFFNKKVKYVSKVEEFLNHSITLINRDTDIKVMILLDKKDKTFRFTIRDTNRKTKSITNSDTDKYTEEEKQRYKIKKTLEENLMIKRMVEED